MADLLVKMYNETTLLLSLKSLTFGITYLHYMCVHAHYIAHMAANRNNLLIIF